MVCVTSPLLILISGSAVFGALGSIFLVISISVEKWQSSTWNTASLNAYTSNSSGEAYQVEIPSGGGYYKVTQKTTPVNTTGTVYHIYDETAGLWQLCDTLSDSQRSAMIASGGKFKEQCYTFVTDYDEDDSEDLTDGAKRMARMHNSAASCFIVTTFDLLAAAGVGVFSVVQKQVAACMVAGVFYIMACLFAIFGLAIYHTKLHYEESLCDTFETFPTSFCNMRQFEIYWPITTCWIGVAFCGLASVLWLILSRSLRVIKAKTML